MDDWRNSLPPVQGFAPADDFDLIDEDDHVQADDFVSEAVSIESFGQKFNNSGAMAPGASPYISLGASPFVSLGISQGNQGAPRQIPRASRGNPKTPQIPPLQIPQGPPRNWDRGAMVKRVRVGMMIELSTIPLYLYAMYSVKPIGDGIQIRATLRAVVQQEMLHLALAGNLLTAIEGSLDLYDPRVVPRYPGRILLGNIPMSLEPLTSETLGHFMEIESASDGYSHSGPNDRTTLASQYSSIGALYEDLITGVRGLPDEEFAHNEDKQFSGNNFFGDQLFAVTNQVTALQALRTIIEQGEGNLAVADSHYDVFSKLYSKPNSWEVHHVPNNPQTSDYATKPYICKLSRAFNAAYCYLLQTIQRVWQTSETSIRRVLFRNIHSIMSNVLTPLAEILILQPLPSGGVAAPCFSYHALIGGVGGALSRSPTPLSPAELHRQLGNRMQDAANAAPNGEQKYTLGRMKRYINDNLKPST